MLISPFILGSAIVGAVGSALFVRAKRRNRRASTIRVFDHVTIKSAVTHADAIQPIETAFAKLAKQEVTVPFPMHIGIPETSKVGPGDCHIKGGYILGEPTFTVKLGCVSFYKNAAKGLPPGGGLFVVMSATSGVPLAVLHDNRYLTDIRTGAAGAVALKYLADLKRSRFSFIGAGKIAADMAKAAAIIRPGYTAYVYARNGSGNFCSDMSKQLRIPFVECASAREACSQADVIFTTTPGDSVVLQKEWLQEHVTIIAAGSDQPTKQELPPDVLANAKYIADLTRQCARVGELRAAIAAGLMTESDVYAELGDVVSGHKRGRVGDEMIVCDLTGTGAQDAAIGQVAWDKLK